MNIGNFSKNASGIYTGTLPTMGLNNVTLTPVEQKGKGPSFRASVGGYEVGAAWERTSQKGKSYLSLQIDQPGRETVYVAIFTTDTPGEFEAVWNKPQPRAENE